MLVIDSHSGVLSGDAKLAAEGFRDIVYVSIQVMCSVRYQYLKVVEVLWQSALKKISNLS